MCRHNSVAEDLEEFEAKVIAAKGKPYLDAVYQREAAAVGLESLNTFNKLAIAAVEVGRLEGAAGASLVPAARASYVPAATSAANPQAVGGSQAMERPAFEALSVRARATFVRSGGRVVDPTDPARDARKNQEAKERQSAQDKADADRQKSQDARAAGRKMLAKIRDGRAGSITYAEFEELSAAERGEFIRAGGRVESGRIP